VFYLAIAGENRRRRRHVIIVIVIVIVLVVIDGGLSIHCRQFLGGALRVDVSFAPAGAGV